MRKLWTETFLPSVVNSLQITQEQFFIRSRILTNEWFNYFKKIQDFTFKIELIYVLWRKLLNHLAHIHDNILCITLRPLHSYQIKAILFISFTFASFPNFNSISVKSNSDRNGNWFPHKYSINNYSVFVHIFEFTQTFSWKIFCNYVSKKYCKRFLCTDLYWRICRTFEELVQIRN